MDVSSTTLNQNSTKIELDQKFKSNWDYFISKGTFIKIDAIACSQDGKIIVIAQKDRIQILNSSTGLEAKKEINGYCLGINQIFYPHNNLFLIVLYYLGTVEIWNLETGIQYNSPFFNKELIFNVDLSKDSQYIAIKIFNGVKIYSTKNLENKCVFQKFEYFSNPSFFPNSYVIMLCNKQQMRVYFARFLTNKTHYYQIDQQFNEIKHVKLSPNGRMIGVSVNDKIKICDYQRNKLITKFQTPIGKAMIFSPSGGYLASGYDDGSIKLWDIIQRKYRMLEKKHDHPVLQVEFSPDGQFILSLDKRVL